MKKHYYLFAFLISLFSLDVDAQERPDMKKIKLTGNVIEKTSGQPLEYATIVLQNARKPEIVTGGITDSKGEFNIEINAGTYNVRVEFISFKTVEFKQKSLKEDTNLGTIILMDDATQLEGVEIRAERSTVEIKLDKKVYNVGQDMLVKGGTVSDVLNNVPSVSVDVEGNVSLRGNENVRILIDGKPSGLVGINVAEALRLIPADAIDKVEVITNPSARYDAEGGGGIVNIILKKGKNLGLNGSVILSVGDPENTGVTGNVNFKSEDFNIFTTQGYNKRNSPGNSLTDSQYYNSDGSIRNYIDERRTNQRMQESYSGNFGTEWFLDKTTTWINTFSYRKSNGENPDNVFFYNYDADRMPTFTRNRLNNQKNYDEDLDYASNFIKNFKKQDHKLTVDFSFSQNIDEDTSTISDDIFGDAFDPTFQRTANKQKQRRHLVQTDYVLPIGENSRFEAGYRGNFSKIVSDYDVENFDADDSSWTLDTNFSNVLEYIENVNALYTQFGSKINKFSYLFGLRWEDSHIEVNQLATNDLNTKKYNNFFPSAFFAYEFKDESSASLSYSRRIQRPRGRFLNPFPNLSSNINIFRGNPDLNPAMTDAIDVGYIKRWKKLTFNTSLYVNKTENVYQFVRRESGDFYVNVVDGADVFDEDYNLIVQNGGLDLVTPIILSGPINLATEYRLGFEFTLNYTPYKWWRLNGNFNFFRNELQGFYNYTNFRGEDISLDLSNVATSWFARINSKVSLPYKIDWQTNATYNAPQNNAQGRNLGILSANLAFSKDVLKEKGTISLNVSDVFNSRKRISETYIPNVLSSYNEFQWRQRQVTLSFTYRFNRKKNEKERQQRGNGGGDEEFAG